MPNASFAGYLLTIQPYAPAYNGLGMIATQHRDFAEARRDFDRATQLDEAYVDGQLNLGILCTDTQDLPCARKAFRAFLAIAPPQLWKGDSSGKVDARRPPEEWSPSVTIPTEHILSRIASLHAQTFTSFRKCILTMSY